MSSTTDIEKSAQKITTEATSLEPNTLVNFFEIDISEIKSNTLSGNNLPIADDILRFHNLHIMEGRTLWFQGKQFYGAPVVAEGFNLSSSGELPRPKLSITTREGMNDTAVAQFVSLKRAFVQLGHLVGAKVTRIRTFVKFLDAANDIEGVAQEPDEHAQFPKEIFYIDSKTVEDKKSIQFELSSVLDVQNFKLPGRLVLSTRCPWVYRGEGCCFEFRANDLEDKKKQKETFGGTDHLPKFAPPIANAENKLISDTINGYSPDLQKNSFDCGAGDILCPVEYNKNNAYPKKQVVYLEKNGIKYYFVAKGNTPVDDSTPVPEGFAPPNALFWEPDQCSKTISGCKLRWGATGAAKNCTGTNCSGKTHANSLLPFGGFPGTNTKASIL